MPITSWWAFAGEGWGAWQSKTPVEVTTGELATLTNHSLPHATCARYVPQMLLML